jgi:hypothetical protein
MTLKLPFLTLCLMMAFPMLSGAQSASISDSLVQLNGVVFSKDSLKPLPAVSVVISGTRRGTQTNERGTFGLVTLLGQEIIFSCVGYKTQRLRVTAEMQVHPGNIVTILEVDTLDLLETHVLIYPTRDQFEHDFITSRMSDPAREAAAANLQSADLKKLSRSVPLSAQEAGARSLQAGAARAATANLVPSFFTTNLLDPFGSVRTLKKN